MDDLNSLNFAAARTPLIASPDLAARLGVGMVLMKDEGARPLGNFKILGGLTAGLRTLSRASADGPPRRLICASDGNHGLAVAAAAKRAGAAARVYLPDHADAGRAQRIAALGAEVVRIAGTYDDAVRCAQAVAEAGEGLLVADTSDDPNDPVVADVMDGYALLTDELAEQFVEAGHAPTHAFLQAGVGGLAAAVTEGLAKRVSEGPEIIIVEPHSAACVGRALASGRPVQIAGDLHTSAGMLACGLASARAVQVLLRHRAAWIGVDEIQLAEAPRLIHEVGGPATTPSGGAGMAGLMAAAADPRRRAEFGLSSESSVLVIISERDRPDFGS